MIRIKPELLAALRAGGKDAVIDALGNAIRLELATIPPYLYALYSLDPTKNAAIAQIVQSVVQEEMLHMTLGCNILNALGGTPVVNTKDFVPTYPGPLPGSVQEGLIVGLAPFSKTLVHDVFMQIEEPEDPLRFPVELSAVPRTETIGEFYGEIKEQIAKLGDGAFSATPRYQIGPELMEEAVVVTNVDSAVRAITTIVEQGEGTSNSPREPVGNDYAHYYRFAEIYHGRKLIPNPSAGPDTPPDEQFVYGGAPVVLDPTGIFGAPTNPTAATYPVGSAARFACDSFNYSYTSLLNTLQLLFTGQPDRFDAAIGLMMSLRQQAIDMMSGTTVAGESVGPSFEYQLTNG
ncbi:MAG TPA: ferritin-like protein [Chloroflexota bacterium]|nr:ferritin-like protein [Chloroflexota bacterium]